MLLLVIQALLSAFGGVLLPWAAALYIHERHPNTGIGGNVVGFLAWLFGLCFLAAVTLQRLPAIWQPWAAGGVIAVYGGFWGWVGCRVHRGLVEFAEEMLYGHLRKRY